MKKTALLLAVIMLALPILSCADSSDVKVPKGMQLCTNDVINYNLFVPDEWTPSISTGAVGAYCSAEDTTNVTVMAWNVDSSMTLDKWWDGYKQDFELVFDDMSDPKKENTTLGGAAAQKYTYTAKLGEHEYYYVQVACIHWSMVYVLTFTSTPEKCEQHMEDLGKIIEYFEFH